MAQLGLQDESLRPTNTVIYANCAPRVDRQEARKSNEGEGILYGLLENGVTLVDPARFDVRGSLSCGRDVSIDVNCVFEGQVHLGEGVRIGAHCFIAHAVIEADVVLALLEA